MYHSNLWTLNLSGFNQSLAQSVNLSEPPVDWYRRINEKTVLCIHVYISNMK